MPAVNDKVMSMVEQELRKNPKVDTKVLFEKAKKIDPSIADLSPRQFNARYPLQVRRRNAPKRARTRRPAVRRAAATTNAQRQEAVRSVLLQFAKDIAAAEGKVDVVEVIGSVDRYVEDVLKAATGR